MFGPVLGDLINFRLRVVEIFPTVEFLNKTEAKLANKIADFFEESGTSFTRSCGLLPAFGMQVRPMTF